jgi:uncharacterized protein with GYD domain
MYIILWNFTDQGIKNRKDSLQSLEIFKGYTERMGRRFHGTYYSFGLYNAVSLVEADANDVRYALLQAEKQGNVRGTTLKAITHEEALVLFGAE